jgi:hypothetical protein
MMKAGSRPRGQEKRGTGELSEKRRVEAVSNGNSVQTLFMRRNDAT